LRTPYNTHVTDHPLSSLGPLAGIRVLELGGLIAGPFAGQLLGDYGAEVLKIERPGDGDPMRSWGVESHGGGLWWPAIARNKRSLAIDLHAEEGRSLVRRIVPRVDIVLENFRPGRLRDWGLDYETLSGLNPVLILVHISGFGQTGPRAAESGFGSIGEATGGIRYTTGEPDHPPARSGISLGDSLAGVFAVIGALAALQARERSGQGQEVDVAIYEAVAALMESTMADFEIAGVLRRRSGSVLPGVAPSNAYPTADGSDLIMAANTNSVFARLCVAMNRPELADDDRYATHSARGRHMAELDDLISDWTRTRLTDELLQLLATNGVPAGKVYSAEDMLNDPHYRARDMVVRAEDRLGRMVPMPGVVPKFMSTPGAIADVGPRLGEHTRTVLRDFANVDDEEWASLALAGIVAQSGEQPSTPTHR
jgi:formyl-CoA transferase